MMRKFLHALLFMPGLVLLSWGVLSAQDITVQGTVSTVDNPGGMPGVSVSVPGNTARTVTDERGHYQLSGVAPSDVLIFSFIGYRRDTVAVNDRKLIDIQLQHETAALDQLLVVGYGTQKRADITGSVVRIETDKTADLPDYNILQSLQGRVPGVNIATPVRPGDDPGLSIRGTNSISAGNSPLIVVDGIIYNGDLSDFNTNDIASVDILKDASAAAVYGSRSANGVLLITTKTGTTEKAQFDFNMYQGIQNPTRLIPVLDGPKYLQKILDFREATGLEADPDKIESYMTVTEVENYKNGQTTDWMDRVLRTGVISNYHLDVSGKSKTTEYYVAGTYFNQEGIVVNDKFHRITLNLNLNNHITDWYSIATKAMFSSQSRPGTPANFASAYQQSPYGSFYDENGPGGYAMLPVGDPIGVNPLVNTLLKKVDVSTSLWGLISSNLNVPFIPGLKWTLNYSANLRNAKLNKYTDNISTPAGITANGIGSKSVVEDLDWTLDNIINYQRTFNQVHSLDITLLYSRESSRTDSSGLSGRDFFTQVTGYDNLSLAQLQQIGSNYGDQNSIAYMGRINYGYDNRYAITLTTRKDGFSGFSQNHKYAVFPSVAFAWTASNEQFLKRSSWLNYLKLRLSYGKNGNQAVGRYQSLARLASNLYVFDQQSTPTIYVNSIANNDLTWETTATENIGIDFSILKSRISGNIDVYSSNTTGILLKRALPQTSGFDQILTNIGKVHNQGIELALNSINISNAHSALSWESGFVFSLNRNKIVQLTGEDADHDGKEDDDIRDGWFIGQSLYSIFGYKTNGIYQLNESNIPPGFEPGDFRIVDTNHDGKLTPDDRVILGNTLPNYSFSISNTVRFRNFVFYVLINSIQGGHHNSYVGNNNATRNVNAPTTTFSERFNLQDVPYWTPTRSSNEYPRVNYNPTLPHPILEDRSFVRIQDVSLSYTFGKPLLDRLKITNLKLYASVKNLYTFTKWTGYDPEDAITLTGYSDDGVNHSSFPLMRTYTVGVDFKF